MDEAQTAPERKNESAFRTPTGTELTQPRSLSDLKTWLHSDRIRHPGDKARTTRETIIISGIETLEENTGPTQYYYLRATMRRASKELADLYPDLAWLPDWKPRTAVSFKTATISEGDGQ